MNHPLSTFTVLTFGCKTNQYDSASIISQLKQAGLSFVDDPSTADLVIINTCTVTERADYKARQLIRRIRRADSNKKIIATGCYADRKAKELLEMKEIDLFTGNDSKDRFQSILDSLNRRSTFLEGKEEADFSNTIVDEFPGMTRAMLQIQTGCNRACSYCIVPLVRGLSRSLEKGKVIERIKRLEEKGYKEVILTGIHIGLWGGDLSPAGTLAELLDSILSNTSDIHIRLSSLESGEIDDRLISIAAADRRIMPHFHIPLQSGSPEVLKLMNRPQDMILYFETIEKIMSLFEYPALGTDIIAGFPGETEKDFQMTIDAVEQLPFSYLHIFPFSPRPGTKAEKIEQKVPDHEITGRALSLRKLGKLKKKNFAISQIGMTREALTLRKAGNKRKTRAITDNYIQLEISENLRPNSVIKVKLEKYQDGITLASPV